MATSKIKDRVTSFCPRGGANSTFITVDESKIVQVPEKISSLAAAIITGIYLPVFQAMNIGLSKENRYNLKAHALKGKRILLHAEASSSFIEPLLRLAKSLGAKDVYLSFPDVLVRSVDHFKSLGAKIYDESFEGNVDILVNDTEDTIEHIDARNILSNGFKVIIQKYKPCTAALRSSVEKISTIYFCYPHFIYNPADYWETELEQSKKDLKFLLDLVHKKVVLPKLGRTLRLEDVHLAYLYLEMKNPLRGSFVCLPWHK